MWHIAFAYCEIFDKKNTDRFFQEYKMYQCEITKLDYFKYMIRNS